MFAFDWAGAEAGFKKALQLSPGATETYAYYGRMCAGLERYDEAIALHERAHELDPFANRNDIVNSLLRAGRNQEAERAAAEAIELEPNDPRSHASMGWALFREGHVEQGLTELERAVILLPGESIWLAQLGQASALAGRTGKARDALQQLEDPNRSPPASPFHLAYVYAGLSDHERAMDCLERAFDEGTGSLFAIKGSFLLAPLRGHPRFVALLRRMRLA
jgi:tetratricopeptide (TPR) repeat protein